VGNDEGFSLQQARHAYSTLGNQRTFGKSALGTLTRLFSTPRRAHHPPAQFALLQLHFALFHPSSFILAAL
jgi:hypothetical protein